MRLLIFLAVCGIFFLETVDSRSALEFKSEQSPKNEDDLMKSLIKHTNELNNTIHNYTNYLNGKNYSLAETCQELEDALSEAQGVVTNATVLMVEVLQKATETVSSPPSCLTINIFSIMSCVAHKAQDVKNLYKQYEEKISTYDKAAAKKMTDVFHAFIICVKRFA